MDINCYLNGILIENPENIKEFSIELNFDRNSTKTSFSAPELHWVNENAKNIYRIITSGNVFVGQPFQIDVVENGETVRIFDGYLNLSDNAKISCFDITCKAQPLYMIEWLFDIAEAFTFQYIYDVEKLIKPNDIKYIPYCCNSIPRGMEAFTSLASMFVIYIEIKSVEARIAADTAPATVNPFQAANVISVAIDITWLLLLIVAFIDMLLAFIFYIIQPIKYHSGMYVKDLFRIGAEKCGLKFYSPIFEKFPYNKLFYIPPKYQLPPAGSVPALFKLLGANANISGVVGYLNKNELNQNGFYKGTFNNFIQDFLTLFNAKIVIQDGTLIVARWDYNTSNDALYQLPPLRNDFHFNNSNEIKSTEIYQFQVDFEDKNTIDKYKGTLYQVYTKSKNEPAAQELNLIKGYNEINFNFALAKRKEDLTIPEQLLKGIVNVINVTLSVMQVAINGAIILINNVIKLMNNIIKALNWIIHINIKGLTPIKKVKLTIGNNVVDNRIGMLLLENDYIGTGKLLILNEDINNYKNNKINELNEELLTAKNIYNEFYYIDNFAVNSDGTHNQWVIPEELKNVRVGFKDFQKLQKSKDILDFDGTPATLISCKWNLWEQIADIKYRVNKQYSDELYNTFIEPDGN